MSHRSRVFSPLLARRATWTLVLAAVALPSLPQPHAEGADAQWIWTNRHQAGHVPHRATCYFRKSFSVRRPGEATLTIAADDSYEVYLNGRKIGSGRHTRHTDKYDLKGKLIRGRNTLAVKVVNESGSTAALMAQLMVRDGGRWRSYSTDDSWKTSTQPLPLWQSTFYSDARWETAVELGHFGETAPWDRAENVAKDDVGGGERFSIVEGFAIERVLGNDVTGSLIAMTFDEFGHLIVSREGHGLLRIKDTDGDDIPDQVNMYCDRVKNCQGILALNGDVFVTGDGPDGAALYRLQDVDRDGKLDKVTALIRFEGSSSEHGAHGLALGPDGLIYVVVGNHAKMETKPAFTSPYRNPYEGDLVPRYEDPGGHAKGVRAPGGVVLRTDVEGTTVQVFAGGMRNVYDLAFNKQGDLFVHESDMESDLGMTWYRPTQVFHVTAGADLGWRSGWAKWPAYYMDACPPLVSTGRGSPTGCVVYEHTVFPRDYHGALFLGDWSEGRILAVRLQPQGSTYRATTEVFLKGQPLNVTDLDVGPTGALYFVTGGRGTRGGIYRVRWTGPTSPDAQRKSTGIAAVIRQRQPSAAWARQMVAQQKESLGAQWDRLVPGVSTTRQNQIGYRTRAMQLMQWYGPLPQPELLKELAADSNEEIRAWAAKLMGWNISEPNIEQLVDLLGDRESLVRRAACEALLHASESPPADTVLPLLAAEDRLEMTAARRLLERIPVDQWRAEVIRHDDLRVFLVGSLALVIAAPDREDGLAILQQCRERMQHFISDRDFLDMLRLMQVTIERCELAPQQLADLGTVLSEEFPTGNAHLNRELMKLLAFLGADEFLDRALDYLESDVELAERIHVAMLLRFVPKGWTPEKRLRVLSFLENAQKEKAGGSYTLYLIHATRDFAKQFGPETARAVILQGDRMPNAALGALYTLGHDIDPEIREALVSLDEKLAGRNDDSAQRLRVGIVAVLAQSGDAQSHAYLRKVWEEDPSRRNIVALGLSSSPDGENWSYLVRSIPILEGTALRQVLRRLRTVPLAPEEGEYYRHVILAGLRLGEAGAADAASLLAYWTGEERSSSGEGAERMKPWQQWFRKTYPDGGAPVLPQSTAKTKWKLDALLEYLEGEGKEKAVAARGSIVFRKANCAKCHQFDGRGEPFGPDLTTVAKRFTRREVLESILFPSHVISSQYQGKRVRLVDGRVLTGLLVPAGDDEVALIQADGSRLTFSEDDIEESAPSKISPMPAGLLEDLSLEEVNDLMAYLLRVPEARISRAPRK